MTFTIGLRDFFGGLTRGFALFFTERNDFVAIANAPGLVDRKQH